MPYRGSSYSYLTAEGRVRFQTSTCRICGQQNDIATGVSPNTSVPLHQTSVFIIDATATVSLNSTLKKKLHEIIHDAGKEAEECNIGEIRNK